MNRVWTLSKEATIYLKTCLLEKGDFIETVIFITKKLKDCYQVLRFFTKIEEKIRAFLNQITILGDPDSTVYGRGLCPKKAHSSKASSILEG